MAFAYIFSALILLLLIGGPILAVVAFRRATALQEALGRANARIESLETRLAGHPSEEAEQPRQPSTEAAPEAEAATSDPGEPVCGLDTPSAASAAPVSEPSTASPAPAGWQSEPVSAHAWGPMRMWQSTSRDAETPNGPGDAAGGLERTLTSRWLVWLGGVTIALAGIFLVKYSIDQDWLNPSVRCALGALGGVALAIAGEWVRRRPLQRAMEIVEPGVIPPALSAAGIAMLYSSVYAAFALYDLIGALFAFVVLAVVSFASFALALLQGRFIAVLGLVGGYLVPALVSTGEGSAPARGRHRRGVGTGEGSAPALFSFLGVLAVAWLAIAYGLYLRSDGSARDTFTWGWRVLGAVAAAQLVALQILGGPLWRPDESDARGLNEPTKRRARCPAHAGTRGTLSLRRRLRLTLDDRVRPPHHPADNPVVSVQRATTTTPIPSQLCQSTGCSSYPYFGRDDLTRESFLPDGFFRTGDQARMDEDGYIKITGRIKDLIIRGGVNIAPVEIESVLFAHPKVANAAVVGMPDPRLGERICACVILDADAAADSTRTVGEVQVWMQEAGRAKPKWPERIEVVDTFPMTASGKVQKFRLREWIAARLAAETGCSA